VNLRKACHIDDAARAPKFDFDSSTLSSNDRDVLSQVARCLTSGSLQGKSVSLVGRPDPRGEAENNVKSRGQQRANSARTYLQHLGLDSGRVTDTSRGALDAQGNDEDTWRLDRRVDIELVP
jgi:peptidoglycan-associated lipoprotein